MNFAPVNSLNDLATLDGDEIMEGYRSGRANDPEPGHNRGRSFWHGWRNGMMDGGHLKGDEHSAKLARDYLAEQRRLRAANA